MPHELMKQIHKLAVKTEKYEGIIFTDIWPKKRWCR